MADELMFEPVVWENALGKTRYQPQLPNGDRLWYVGSSIYPTFTNTGNEYYDEPILMSRWRAIHKAKKYWNSKLKDTWKEL
jgi:hypothetical protein